MNISEFAEDFSQKAMHSDDNLVFPDFLKHAIASVLKLENLDDLSNYSMGKNKGRSIFVDYDCKNTILS